MERCRLLLLESGIVALDNNIISSIRFDHPINSYMNVKNLLESEELSIMLEDLRKKGYNSIYTNDEALAKIASRHGMRTEFLSNEEILELQEKKIEIMLASNFAPSEKDAVKLLREFAIEMSSRRVKEVSARRDLHIIQSINALDELDKTVNIMISRIREWYGLHFPELDSMIENLNTYCEIVSLGSRENININELRRIGFTDKAQTIFTAATNSKGGEITTDNMNMLRRIAEDVKNLHRTREHLAKHLDKEMEEIAPNLKDILGSTVGARMIAKAGSLERLASMSASTIQVLGAEKALFRAMKTGTRPPKHGLLFQHILIHSAPAWQRGKIARAIASTTAIAARIDLFKGAREPLLLEKLNSRIEEIRKHYSAPPETVKEVRYREEKEKGMERRRERYRGERRERGSKGKKRRFERRRHGRR